MAYKQQIYLSQFWRLRSPELRHLQIWSLRTYFLVHRPSHGRRGRSSLGSLIRALIPFVRAEPSLADHPTKALIPSSHWGLGFLYEFWGPQTFSLYNRVINYRNYWYMYVVLFLEASFRKRIW